MKYLLIIFTFFICAVSLAADNALPSASDMRVLTKEKIDFNIKQAKIKFRDQYILSIRQMANKGYYWTEGQPYPSDKRIYEEFFEELKKAGYKLHLGKEQFWITWDAKDD